MSDDAALDAFDLATLDIVATGPGIDPSEPGASIEVSAG